MFSIPKSVRTEATGGTAGSFGVTGVNILSFGTLHHDIVAGVVFTIVFGSAGIETGASDSDWEAIFVRLMRLKRFLGIKKSPAIISSMLPPALLMTCAKSGASRR